MTIPPLHNLLKLACLSALMLALIPASRASAANETIPFKVSVKGQIHETYDRAFECSSEAGGADISFTTHGFEKTSVKAYGGWRDDLLAEVHSDRRGTRTVTCDGEPGSPADACAAEDFKSRVRLDFVGNPLTLGMYGDREAHGYGNGCLYAPDPFPEKEQEFDTLQLLWDHGAKSPQLYNIFGGQDGRGHRYARKRRWTVRYEDTITRPYRYGGQKVGTYTADVEYVVKFRRLGPLWPGGGKPPWNR
jgi:hypothetical protein